MISCTLKYALGLYSTHVNDLLIQPFAFLFYGDVFTAMCIQLSESAHRALQDTGAGFITKKRGLVEIKVHVGLAIIVQRSTTIRVFLHGFCGQHDSFVT